MKLLDWNKNRNIGVAACQQIYWVKYNSTIPIPLYSSTHSVSGESYDFSGDGENIETFSLSEYLKVSCFM